MATILNLNQDCRWNIAKVFPDICYISKVVSKYFGRKYDFKPVWNLEIRNRILIIDDELYYYDKVLSRYRKCDKRDMITDATNIIDYNHRYKYFYHADNKLFHLCYHYDINEILPIECDHFNISNINICDGKLVKRKRQKIFIGAMRMDILIENIIDIKPAKKRPAKLEDCMSGRKYLFIHPIKLTNCVIEDGLSFYIPSNLNKWRYIRPVKAILQNQKEMFSVKNIWYLILFGHKIVCLRTVIPNTRINFIFWREVRIAKIMETSVLEKVLATKSVSYDLRSGKKY